MIPVLLALAAAALYLLPLMIPKPPPPDEVALPPLPGAPTPTPVPDFVAAVAAYDRLRAFVGPRHYPPDEAAKILAALQTLRLALVDPPSLPTPEATA